MNRKILTQPEHLRAINTTNTHKKVILFSFFNRRSFPFNRRFDLKDNGQGSLFTPSLWLNSNFITIISNVDHLGGVSNEVSSLLSLSPLIAWSYNQRPAKRCIIIARNYSLMCGWECPAQVTKGAINQQIGILRQSIRAITIRQLVTFLVGIRLHDDLRILTNRQFPLIIKVIKRPLVQLQPANTRWLSHNSPVILISSIKYIASH